MSIIKSFRWYSKIEIQQKAEEILNQVESKRCRRLPAANLAEIVADHLDLGIIWDTLESDAEGEIAAMILPTEKEIIINSQIPALAKGFGQSTIAHEVGHWILHINHQEVDKFIDYRNQNLEISRQPFLCRSSKCQQGIEWQAQYFATCLLMPVNKLEKARQGRDLTNWNHLYAIADELGVTISNLKNRLIELNWIIQSSNSKRIYLGKLNNDE